MIQFKFELEELGCIATVGFTPPEKLDMTQEFFETKIDVLSLVDADGKDVSGDIDFGELTEALQKALSNEIEEIATNNNKE